MSRYNRGGYRVKRSNEAVEEQKPEVIEPEEVTAGASDTGEVQPVADPTSNGGHSVPDIGEPTSPDIFGDRTSTLETLEASIDEDADLTPIEVESVSEVGPTPLASHLEESRPNLPEEHSPNLPDEELEIEERENEEVDISGIVDEVKEAQPEEEEADISGIVDQVKSAQPEEEEGDDSDIDIDGLD